MSEEAEQVREELGILTTIQHICGEGRIQAKEHHEAGRVLGYLEGKIQEAQARLNALAPPVEEPPPQQEAAA